MEANYDSVHSTGRVFLFLNTDDFWRDYNEIISKGIEFVREPKEQDYGIVADLLEMNKDHPIAKRIM